MAAAVLCLASLRPAVATLVLLAAMAIGVPLLAFRSGVILPILPSLGCLLLSAPAALWLRARLPRFPEPHPTEPHS
jgi:hypothetical protein